MEQKPILQDDIDKAKAYKEALDELQKSVVGLNSKLPSFADGMKAGIQAIGEKLPDVVESIKNLNEQNRQLAESGGKPVSIIKQLASSMLSWNTLISVGVTLLATYSDAIIDWVSSLFKGETRLTAFGKAMKEQAILTNALLDARLKGAQSAQSELTALNILYKASQNHNLSLEEQQKARQALRDQWPATFNNLTDEAFKTGEAAKAYKNLKERILDAAYAEAYKNKITSNASRSIENDLKIAKEREKNLKIVKEENVAAANLHNYMFPNNGVNPNISDRYVQQLTEVVNIAKEKRTASDSIIFDLHTDKYRLKKQNETFLKEIEKLTEKPNNGVSILISSKPDNKPLSSNKIINTQNTQVEQSINLQSTAHATPKAKIDTSRAEKLMKAKSIDFAQTLELNKTQYDLELKQLDGLLRDKEISQEEFNKRSERLQRKYQQNIGNNAELFAKQNMADMKKAMDVLAGNLREKEGQQKKDVISQDEKDLKKAKLPGSQFAAERKLIDDKYAYELFMAGNNTEKKKAIEEQHLLDVTALTERHEQQRREFAINTAQKVADTAFSLLGNNIKANTEAKIKGLEKDKANELSNTNLTSTQRKAVEEKYKKKEEQEKVKAFKAEQRMSILQAVVNGALAITKATSQTGVLAPFVIPGIIASTAVQIATIASQKPPQFAKGGQFVSDGRGALLPGYSRTDNTNAYLRSGEAVVVSEAMRNPWARNLVSAINVAYGGRDFSMPNPGKGYAIGGIYTDGGNANRYYSQPVVDVKEMANTLAYQMVNNFPPIYVDVKDVNNQQNILAQTVNRVNL